MRIKIKHTIKNIISDIVQYFFNIKFLRSFIPINFWEITGRINHLHRLFRKVKLTKIKFNKQLKGKKILFLRMRHVPRHLALEVVLSLKLNSMNNNCVFAFCSPILPICNGWDIRDLTPRKTCEYCFNNNLYFSEKFPFKAIFLEDYVRKEEIEFIINKYNDLKIEDLKSFSVCNYDLGDELYLSLAKFLFRGTVPETPTNLKYARDFAISGEIIVTGLLRIIKKERPEIVILNSGHIFWYGIAYKILKKLKIKTISYDETNIAVTKLTWTFDDTNPCVDYNWTNHWEIEKEKEMSKNEAEMIDELIKTRKKYFLYKKDSDTIPLKQLFDISKYQIKIALFTNVLWDATVVGKNPIFESMIDWILHTINLLKKNKEACLIIRVHPAEAGVYGMISNERVRHELQIRNIECNENILLIDAEEKVNSYDIIENSDVILSYASNIGLEAVLESKPVIVVGSPHYKNRGFTIDPKSIEEYDSILKKILKGEIPVQSKIKLAKKYAKLAFIDTQFEVNIFYDHHPHLVNKLSFNNFKELEDNKQICRITELILRANSIGYFLTQ